MMLKCSILIRLFTVIAIFEDRIGLIIDIKDCFLKQIDLREKRE